MKTKRELITLDLPMSSQKSVRVPGLASLTYPATSSMLRASSSPSVKPERSVRLSRPMPRISSYPRLMNRWCKSGLSRFMKWMYSLMIRFKISPYSGSAKEHAPALLVSSLRSSPTIGTRSLRLRPEWALAETAVLSVLFGGQGRCVCPCPMKS